MPTFTNPGYDGDPIEYASEAELLEFANKVRLAGGAEVIEAFFPSNKGNPASCLIANALNFGCEVLPEGNIAYNGEYEHWSMYLPKSLYGQPCRDIANAVGCDTISVADDDSGDIAIKLPRLIGNAAHAFDNASRGWVVAYRA